MNARHPIQVRCLPIEPEVMVVQNLDVLNVVADAQEVQPGRIDGVTVDVCQPAIAARPTHRQLRVTVQVAVIKPKLPPVERKGRPFLRLLR